MADQSLIESKLRTPRAAAIAGILFSVLLTTALVLLRLSVPTDPLEPGAWLGTSSKQVMVGLHMVPFAGIAFLWFIAVLRDRLGEAEDRFFATVLLGSGFAFLVLLFVAAAAAGAIIVAAGTKPDALTHSGAYTFARAFAYTVMNIYALKAAAVFMISTSTLTIYTGIAASWIAYLGYALALFLLLGGGFTDWTFLVFPLWVLLMSVDVLIDNLRRSPSTAIPD